MSSENRELIQSVVETVKHVGETSAPKAGIGGGIFTVGYDWVVSGFSSLSSVGALGILLTAASLIISYLSYKLRKRMAEEENSRKAEMHSAELQLIKLKLEKGD